MTQAQDPITELRQPAGTRPVPGGGGASRRGRRWLRIAGMNLFGLGVLAAVAMAVVAPGGARLPWIATAPFLLLALLFLIREDRLERAACARERYLWARLLDLSHIFDLVLGVRSEADVINLLGMSLQEIMLLLHARLGAVFLVGQGGGDRDTVLGFEDDSHDALPWRLELEGTLRGMESGRPVLVSDLDEDPLFRKAGAIRRAGFRSLAAITIGGAEKGAGLLVVGNPEPTVFREADERIFTLAARLLARALLHGKRLDGLADSLERMKTEHDELTYSGQLKSEFAAVAAHELKTPLTAIKASTEALLGSVRSGEPEHLEEFLDVIRVEADRLIGMTGKILEISSLETSSQVMDRRAVNLERVARDAARILEVHLQEKDMHLNLDLSADLPPIFADPEMLLQVLINLLSNAVKFSTSGQTVTLRARRENDDMCIHVVDLGLGIDGEEQPHVFERFYQGSRQGDHHVPSSGLGLAIVKQIVEQHEGSVSVDSAPGRGSTFSVILPIARDAVGLEGSLLTIQPAGEVEEFLRLSLEWISQFSSSETASLFLDKHGELVPLTAVGEAPSAHAGDLAAGCHAMGESAIGESHQGGGAASIAVPLNFRGQPAGVYLVEREDPPYRQEDLFLVEGIVDRIARGLEHAAEKEDPGRELRRATRAGRDLLAQANKRFPHRVDSGLLAYELTLRAGVSGEAARDVRLAANFHDVAMAQIGEGIEREDRPLRPDEKKKLRQHPRLAAALIKDIQAMEEVARIVEHHHEWFDGRGYPDGLEGEDIPLGARIVAIIDAFCSMIAWRKYRPVHLPHEAAEELVRCSGNQFDPQLVTHFIALLSDKGWIETDHAESLLTLHADLAQERTHSDGSATSECPRAADNTVQESIP